MSFGARAVIRLDALHHNLKTLRDAVPDARLMAVVKANAYGHGLETVARSLDADSFAVARLEEARRLRAIGVKSPIVLLEGVWDAADQAEALSLGCELVVHSPEQLAMLEQQDTPACTVWLKVDTGMNRLGFAPEDAEAALARLRRLGCVEDLRLMTHFSSADEVGNDKTRQQLDRFRPLATGFAGDVSVANSPATFGWDEVRRLKDDLGFAGHQWIRPGIALFGISPFEGRTGDDLGLRPVMQFKGRLIALKPLRQGDAVGYTERYTAERDTIIGVIAAGYGDGYTRHFRDGTPVLLNGRRVPLAGVVSMDMLTVDLGPDATDRVGDIATLWGDGLPIEELVPYCGSLPYTLVCGVTHREPG
ncbi:MAG: alanine racemase [Pseudomonadota bacterium]